MRGLCRRQSAHEPAEEFVQLEKGVGFGWPYAFDTALNKLVPAPEYGGDGKKGAVQRGRIWRVTYTGAQIAGLQPAPSPSAATSSNPPGPPEGTNINQWPI